MELKGGWIKVYENSGADGLFSSAATNVKWIRTSRSDPSEGDFRSGKILLAYYG